MGRWELAFPTTVSWRLVRGGAVGAFLSFFFSFSKFGLTGSNAQAAGVNQELMLGGLYGVVKGGKCML